ncbi:MAG: hypothetical protein IT355_19995 [Gemmatimonadaceae bacterium]|nr:hypothetical protein [Gemmatimonadaceae bacterium]
MHPTHHAAIVHEPVIQPPLEHRLHVARHQRALPLDAGVPADDALRLVLTGDVGVERVDHRVAGAHARRLPAADHAQVARGQVQEGGTTPHVGIGERNHALRHGREVGFRVRVATKKGKHQGALSHGVRILLAVGRLP